MSFIIEGSSNPVKGLQKLDLKIEQFGSTVLFRDFDTSAILTTEPANSLVAVANGANISIKFIGEQETIVTELDINTVKIDGVLQAANQAAIITSLTNLFANVGGGSVPTISNATDAYLVQGATFNFTLAGTNLVTVLWSGLPSGIAPVVGNEFSLVGGSLLGVGTYTFTAQGINYHGAFSKTFTLNVQSSFTNTKSFFGGTTATNKKFLVPSSLGAQSTSPLFRTGNSTGNASDSTREWSAVWYQKNMKSNGEVAIFGAGATNQNRDWAGFDVANAQGGTTDFLLRIEYGRKFELVQMKFPKAGVSPQDWNHCVVTYNGGDTTSTTNPSGEAGVYDCFKFYLNGVNVPIDASASSMSGGGFEGSIKAKDFTAWSIYVDVKLGYSRYSGNDNSNNLYLDEIAFYDYVLNSTQVGLTYNSGTPLLLHGITGVTNPVDYYRMGDGVDPSNSSNTDITQHPVLYNYYSGRQNLEGNNTVVSDYVSEVPS